YGDLTTKDTTNAAKYRFFREYAQQMDAATDTTKETDSRLKDFSRYVFDTQGSAEAERLKEFSADIRDAFARIAEDQVKGATTKPDAQDFVNAKTAQNKALETKNFITQFGTVPEDLEKKYAALAEKIGEGQRFAGFLEKITTDLKDPTPALLTKAKNDAK